MIKHHIFAFDSCISRPSHTGSPWSPSELVETSALTNSPSTEALLLPAIGSKVTALLRVDPCSGAITLGPQVCMDLLSLVTVASERLITVIVH